MTFDMLNDLNKEILNEIGIVVISDVLSILKHIKKLTTDQPEIKDTDIKDLTLSEASGHVRKINHPPKNEVSITNIVLTIYFKENFYFLKESENNKKKCN